MFIMHFKKKTKIRVTWDTDNERKINLVFIQVWWFMSIIPTTWEAEIGRTEV
jgi:hypothetical protein